MTDEELIAHVRALASEAGEGEIAADVLEWADRLDALRRRTHGT